MLYIFLILNERLLKGSKKMNYLNLEIKERTETREIITYRDIEFNTMEELREYRKNHRLGTIENRKNFKTGRKYLSAVEYFSNFESKIIRYVELFQVYKMEENWVEREHYEEKIIIGLFHTREKAVASLTTGDFIESVEMVI